MYSEKSGTRSEILTALAMTLAGVTATLFGHHPWGFGLLGAGGWYRSGRDGHVGALHQLSQRPPRRR
jgi:hypothetical protein